MRTEVSRVTYEKGKLIFLCTSLYSSVVDDKSGTACETKAFCQFFYSSSSPGPPVNVSFLFSFNVPHLM